MVGWYDPGQLARTGVDVLVSTIFGRHADFRLLEALKSPPGGAPWDDFTAEGTASGFWVDYVADVADGWNSTYAVAHALAEPALEVRGVGGGAARHVLPRGQVLVFGGDQVYPAASRTEYGNRLQAPYASALPHTDPPHPVAYAVPGNHDWYDSLVSFTRLFCSRRWLGGWRTQQRRSYFALRLPHGWWLLGTDVQLGSDIDEAQVEFFTRVREGMADDDRVILCNAEPHWIYSAYYAQYDADVYHEGNLAFLQRLLGERALRVFVAGDLHHYRRHEEMPDPRHAAPGAYDPAGLTHKITAGGGGAFLHPTHAPPVPLIAEAPKQDGTIRRFALRASWPDTDTSSRLTWRNLAFGWFNPPFGVLTAVVYALVGWTLAAHLPERAVGVGAFLGTLKNPGPALFVVAVLLTFVLFTDSHSVRQRWIGGLLHGLAHVAVVFWLVTEAHARMGDVRTAEGLLGALALLLVGGYLLGPLIFGVYLLVSLQCLSRHHNEAFSSLRIEDWKHFLRFHVGADGTLTIYPIGLRRVPRRWRPGPGAAGQQIVPDDPRATAPELIEEPIIVR